MVIAAPGSATTPALPTTFSAMRDENQELMEARDGDKSPSRERIIAFIERAMASGTLMTERRERRAAQAMINFWATELITRNALPDSLISPRLAGVTEAGSDKSAEDAAPPSRPLTRISSASPPAASNVLSMAVVSKEKSGALRQALDLASAFAGSLQSLTEPAPAPASPSVSLAAVGGDAELQRARDLVGIGATARRWKESGDPGWLLSGAALGKAERLVTEDDDIGELVRASRVAAAQKRGRRVVLAAGLVVLLALSAWIAWLYYGLRQAEAVLKASYAQLDEKNAQLDEANKTVKLRNAALADMAAKKEELERERDREREDSAETQRVIERERQRQLDRLQAALREVASYLGELRRLAPPDRQPPVPTALRPYLEEAAVELPLLPADRSALAGYNERFLASDALKAPALPVSALPLPKSRDASVETLHYVNFSVAVSRARRVPLFAAVNIRRSALIALQRVNVKRDLDPRLPAEEQPPPGWFEGDIVPGMLVNAREIAWGDRFPIDAVEAGRRAYAMVAVLTNAAPQLDTFDRGLWMQAETYARDRFAPGADRVNVFSGPVLADGDLKALNGEPIPRAYWKLMVAANPADPASLLVEAYLLSQFAADGTRTPSDAGFDLAVKIPLVELERLTGLDFGEALREAAAPSPPPDARPDLTGALSALAAVTGANAPDRRTAVQKVLDTIRNPGLSGADRRQLADAVVGMTRDDVFRALSSQARVNVSTLIAAVPKEWWDAASWIDLKAAARRGVADAWATANCDGGAGPDTCAQLAIARQRLNWGVAANRIVYVQFAGMVRGDVQALSARLGQLGWKLPGEERTPAAARLNEVRYAPTAEDRRAAELLAADYRALGLSTVKAVLNAEVKRGITEAWISN